MSQSSKPLHLYVHIPFCQERCGFCHTPVTVGGIPSGYLDALQGEIRMAAEDFGAHTVESIYLGGGTPTLLTDRALRELLSTIRERFRVREGAEVSIETSPNRIRSQNLIAFQKAGINRVAIGVVTVRTEEAKALGMVSPIGSAETALILPQLFSMKSYEATLLYGIPGQDGTGFLTSLRFLQRYHTPEIALLPFLPPKTAVWEEGAKGRPPLPGEDQKEEMLREGRRFLLERGFTEYLPGLFAQPGHACLHRKARAGGEDYLSFGPGTISRCPETYQTTWDLETYIRHSTEPDRIYRVI